MPPDRGVGGARAVEQLRLVLIELQMAPLRNAVHIGMAQFNGMLMEGKAFDDFPYMAETAQPMLTDLLWWTEARRPAREVQKESQAA